MLLVIDIGNSNISVGIFDSDNIIHTFNLISDKSMAKLKYKELLAEQLKNTNITNCIIGSVVNELTDIIKDSVKDMFGFNPIIVSGKLSLGFRIVSDNPNEAGADRIANIAAAKKMYTLPAIVVDIGTATTFDITDSDGNFIGGIIIPGLRLQMEALSGKTSKLPLIEIKEQNFVVGTNTEENILSGVIRGHACAIEGLLKECEKELEIKPTIIFTGGYSGLISKYTDVYDEINQNLTLLGLKYIYNLNC